MDYLIHLTAAVGATLLGCVMFYIAKQVIEETPTPVGETLIKSLPLKVTAAAMLVCNLLVALFVPWFYGTGTLELLHTLVMCSILWPCAWADAKAYLIPNRVLLVGCLAGAVLLGIQILVKPSQAIYLLLGTAISVGGLLLASVLCRLVTPKSVGMGDIKLLAVMGLCLGSGAVWGTLFFSFVATFFFCIFLLLTKKAKRTDSIPFAPFLLVGTVLAALLTGV